MSQGKAIALLRAALLETSAAGAEVKFRHIREAWAELDPLHKEAMDLYYLQGKKQKTVAAALGISQSAVSKRLRQGIKGLLASLNVAAQAQLHNP